MVKMGADLVQNPATVGYIFGILMSLLIIIVGSVLIHKYGHKGNDAFKYASGPSQRWALPVLIWRVVVFLFSFVTLVGFTFQGDAAYPGQSRAWGLSYFTVWNWMLLNVYFAVGVAVSVVRTFMPERVPELVGDASVKAVEPARTRSLKTLFTAHHLIGEVEVPASLFVALVVWCYLAPFSGDFASWTTFSSVAQHAVNAITCHIDFWLAGWRFNKFHWPAPVMWVAIYMFWHLIANQVVGLMAYPIMYTNSPSFIAFSVGFALLIVLVFWAYYGLSLLKGRCCCFKRAALLDIEAAKEGLPQADSPQDSAADTAVVAAF